MKVAGRTCILPNAKVWVKYIIIIYIAIIIPDIAIILASLPVLFILQSFHINKKKALTTLFKLSRIHIDIRL